jgi:hypothetical protein
MRVQHGIQHHYKYCDFHRDRHLSDKSLSEYKQRNDESIADCFQSSSGTSFFESDEKYVIIKATLEVTCESYCGIK